MAQTQLPLIAEKQHGVAKEKTHFKSGNLGLNLNFIISWLYDTEQVP